MTHATTPAASVASLLALVLLAGPAGDLAAQTTNQFKLPDQFQGLSRDVAGDPSSDLQVSGKIELTRDGTQGILYVTAELGPDWHIYSVTQKAGGPMRTQVLLEPSSQIELSGPFQPDKPPKVRRLEFYDVPIEEHYGRVTWSAAAPRQAGNSPRHHSDPRQARWPNLPGRRRMRAPQDTRYAIHGARQRHTGIDACYGLVVERRKTTHTSRHPRGCSRGTRGPGDPQ